MPSLSRHRLPDHPAVAIVVPCLNEVKFVESFVRQVLAMDCDPARTTLFVVDGMSTDGTREILFRLASGEPRLRVLDNPHRTTARALNCALRVAQADVIVRLDVHAEYPKHYLTHLVGLLQRTGADNVGALRLTAPGRTLRENAFAALVSAPFANGGAPWRARPEGLQDVESVYCGCYPRRVFDAIGLFDESMIRIEDREFNSRLRAAGGRILLDPSLTCIYHARTRLGHYLRWTFSGPFRLFYSRRLTTTPLVRPRNYAPLLFAVYHLCLPPAVIYGGMAALTPLGVYGLVAIGAAVGEARVYRRPALALLLLPLFYLTHVVYGLGGLWGCVRALLPLPAPRPEGKFSH